MNRVIESVWTNGVAVVLALMCLGAGTACTTDQPRAEVVFVGHFVTLDPERPEAEAIAVRDGRIVAMGDLADLAPWIGPDTSHTELPGVALPGFAEGHCHVESFGRQLDLIDLRGLSKEEVLDRVAASSRSSEEGAWIRGQGWDQGFWTPAVFPTAADLDRVVPNQPVLLTRIDGHSAWLNSRALAAAGITSATPEPEGGKIVRDAKGEPTGILVDTALDLVHGAMPSVTREHRKAWLRAALDSYVRMGVTSVHDAGVDLEGIEIYKELLASGDLPLRAYVMAQGEGVTAEHYLAREPELDLGGRLTIRCLKALLDGALGSRGAQLSAPYSDAPSETGLVLMKDEAFAALVSHATERGFQVAVHAIGDRAIDRALDAFEAEGPRIRELRPRIEHVSVVDPADLPRFERLGVIASMQPNFVGEYSRWALDRVGPDRINWVYPTRRLFESGAVVASGTDYPASDSPDPRITLYSLVTRRGADGKPEEGFLPGERLSINEALRTMTAGAAYAAFKEEDLGYLSIGRLADMTVVSADPRTTPPEDLRDLRILVTIVGGEVVFTES